MISGARMSTELTSRLEAELAVETRDDGVHGAVPDGYDVFGIPHGGVLCGLAANAIRAGSGAPDIFSITTHYLRKATVGPMRFQVSEVGGSRRFRSVKAEGWQGDAVVLAVSALVGDRSAISGPSWRAGAPWRPSEKALVPKDTPFPMPAVAERLGLRLAQVSTGFAQGKDGGEARMRAVVEAEASVLAALVACDLAPPAVWNALGLTGWVPTVELTAHVRAVPAPGPMTLEVITRHVAAGFLEEDAEVFDAEGNLVVQSRQLARYSESKTQRPV